VSAELAVVLALLVAAIVMFAINKPRMDAVALIMLIALPLTGVISISEALAGFSDPNIVLIAALFVVGEGLVRTGVAQRLGDWLARKAGSSASRNGIACRVCLKFPTSSRQARLSRRTVRPSNLDALDP